MASLGMACLGLGWWATCTALHWGTATLARHGRAATGASRRGAQDFSLVAPLSGRDDASPAYIGALQALARAGVEVLICVAREDDAAVAPTRAQWATAPILVGSDNTFNPKMNNVRKGLEAASRPIVGLCDAGVLLTLADLCRAAAPLSANVGLVLALKRAEAAENFPACIERAYINGHQARFLLAADRIGLAVASGGVTLLSHDTLQRIGNWRGFNRWIADDYSVARAVRELGMRTRLAEVMPPLPLGQRRWLIVWARQVRWARTRLRLPVWPLVLWEPVIGWLVSALAGGLGLLAAGVPGSTVALALGLHAFCWIAGEKWFTSGRGLAFGPADAVAAMVRELLAPGLILQALGGRTIDWRGTDLGGGWRARRDAGRGNSV